MKIELSDGIETMTIDTQILWWVKGKSFDEMLTDALENLKERGFKVTGNFENYEGWDYIFSNLDKGEQILA